MAFAPSAGAAIVAVYGDGAFVDTAAPPDGELSQVVAILTGLGHTANVFTGTASTDFSTALAGADALFFPEFEIASLNDAIDGATRTVIANFVAAGGRLLIAGTNNGFDGDGLSDVDLLNDTFGFSLTEGSSFLSGVSNQTALGSSSDFAICGDLENFSATTGVGGLPPGAASLYEDDDGASETTVFQVAFGSGFITYLGWDFFSATEVASEEWECVTDVALVGEGIVSTITEVPTLGTVSLLVLALSLVIVGAWRVRAS